jgi:hypothetical protein
MTSCLYQHSGKGLGRLSFVAGTGGRTLTHEESERVRAELVRLKPRFKNQTEFAKWIGEVKQQTISHVINGGQAGTKLARALARKLGVDFEVLVGGEPRRDPTMWRNLNGWADAEAEARRVHRRVPEFAWRLTGETMSATPPPHIDAETIYTFAKAWMDVQTGEQTQRVIEMETEIGEELVRAEDEAFAQRDLPIESRDPPPPPKKLRLAAKKPARRKTPTPPPTAVSPDQKKLPDIS